MRAVVCKEYGPPESLVVEDVPSPALGDDEAGARRAALREAGASGIGKELLSTLP